MELKEYKHLFTKLPCEDAQEWLKSQNSLEEAWNNCHRGDWLWWSLRAGKGTLPKKKVSVEYANWCVSRTKNSYAAAAAAYAADAYAAAYAAAAYAAAYAAAADAYAAYAADAYAADAAARKEQAEWIREHIPYPFSRK